MDRALKHLLLLCIVLGLIATAWWAQADIFTTTGNGGYPSITELGTIVNGGTATCAFATTPICHFTTAAGSTGFTLANPSSNPPAAGQTVRVVWNQAGADKPAITWGTAWFGYIQSTDVVAGLQGAGSLQRSIQSILNYAAAVTGVPGISFEWDGTEYVLNLPQGQILSNVIVANKLELPGSALYLDNKLTIDSLPTIASGFGGTPSIVNNNGTAAFTVNVGSGGSAASGVIGLPLVATDWLCNCTDITTNSTTVFITKQTGRSNTSCTVGNFNDVAVPAAWVANDILSCEAWAY